jgi:HEPN domain-containing protein
MDYISARMSLRAGLIEQFHWQALQALEKYLKAILLYNRIKAPKINHSLSKALNKAEQLPFKLDLTPLAIEFVKHIDTFGRFRYLEASYFIHGPKLVELDRTVWEVRRYCKVLNYEVSLSDGQKKKMLPLELEAIENSKNHPPQQFRIISGALGKIIDNKGHPARAPLIWQNGFFGKSRRKAVRVQAGFQAKNSPLTLHPEILDAIIEYVYLPKEVVDAYRNRN